MNKKDYYINLINHLKDWILGLPSSEYLMPLIELRLTPEEAELLSKIPFIAHTAEQLSKKLDIPVETLEKELEKLAKKGMLFCEDNEFNRKISPFLNKYYIETYANEFIGHETQGLRAIPIHETIQDTREVVPYEDILKVIDNFEYYSVSFCPCSHRHNLDPEFDECKYDLERCLHFDRLGRYCVEQGLGREITKEETLKILKDAADAGLVHGISNTEGKMDTICNCCSCCCLFLESIVKMPGILPRGHQPSNYIREIDEEKCISCGLCARLCPMKALEMKDKKLLFNPERCLGCGICAHNCKEKVTYLIYRDGEQDIPKDPREQATRFLKERGHDPKEIFSKNL